MNNWTESDMWRFITDEQKRECYKSYCEDVRYEFGDRVKPMSYDEWCEEAKRFGEALI